MATMYCVLLDGDIVFQSPDRHLALIQYNSYLVYKASCCDRTPLKFIVKEVI